MVSKKSVDAAPVEAAEGLFGPFIRSAGLPLRRQRGRPRKAPATTVGLRLNLFTRHFVAVLRV